jgi:hypothetical protein
VAVSALTISACRYWLGLVLSRGPRIGRDVWHTVVACLRSECSFGAGNRTHLSVPRQEPDHEQAADGCGYQGEYLFSRRVRRSFQQEGSSGPQVPYPDSCALLHGPQPPREHIIAAPSWVTPTDPTALARKASIALAPLE